MQISISQGLQFKTVSDPYFLIFISLTLISLQAALDFFVQPV
jgi:hypothetical protein